MLNKLYIKNYALIDELDVQFNKGFNVITGETGAGKSIIMDALSLILGNRAETEILRDKSNKCIIEAEFFIGKNEVEQFLIQNDFDHTDYCTIRREITANGKSRAFINDTPATLQLIKELTIQLVDIHSQHQTLDIVNSLNQFDVLDTFCELNEEMSVFRKQFRAIKLLQTQRDELKILQEQHNKEFDYNKFLFEELEKADLKPLEENALETQILELANAETTKNQLQTVIQYLSQSNGIISILKELNSLLTKVKIQNEDFASAKTRFDSVLIELRDLESEIEVLNEKIQVNPVLLNELENRLNLLNTLLSKHRTKTTNDLFDIKSSLESKLQKVNELDEQIISLNQQIDSLNEEIITKGNEIFSKRKNKIPDLEKKVAAILKELNMPYAKLIVDLKPSNMINSYGNCTIDFLFTANKGQEPKSIQKIASGGEFSRMLLALKSILSVKKNIKTMIFDEIDAGVSGEIAGKMGEIMKTISNDVQVFAITHLPQVAVKGKFHYKVIKKIEKEKSVSKLILLDKNNRIEEIAKMLSGETLTPEAIANAKVMLQ